MKKKIISLATVVLSIFALSTSSNATTLGLVYTALGDSLTDPNTYAGKDWTTYPDYLCTDMLQYDVYMTLCNHGVGGYKTGDVLEQIQTDETVINDIKNSNVITLQVGANNITYAMIYSLADSGLISLPFYYSFAPETDIPTCITQATDVLSDKDNYYHQTYITGAKDDLDKIISTIREYNADADIFIATVYFEQETFTRMFQDMFGFTTDESQLLAEQYGVAANEVQNYFKDAAAYNDKVYYVDNSDLASIYYFQYNELGGIADIHPNQSGQIGLKNDFKNAFASAKREQIFTSVTGDFNALLKQVTDEL